MGRYQMKDNVRRAHEKLAGFKGLLQGAQKGYGLVSGAAKARAAKGVGEAGTKVKELEAVLAELGKSRNARIAEILKVETSLGSEAAKATARRQALQAVPPKKGIRGFLQRYKGIRAGQSEREALGRTSGVRAQRMRELGELSEATKLTKSQLEAARKILGKSETGLAVTGTQQRAARLGTGLSAAGLVAALAGSRKGGKGSEGNKRAVQIVS